MRTLPHVSVALATLVFTGRASADTSFVARGEPDASLALLLGAASGDLELPITLDESGQARLSADGPLRLRIDVAIDDLGRDVRLPSDACARLLRDGTCQVVMPIVGADGRDSAFALELDLAGASAGSLRLSSADSGMQMVDVGAASAVTGVLGLIEKVDGVWVDVPLSPVDAPPAPSSGYTTYSVLTYNVAGLPQTAFSHDNFTPDEDETYRAEVIADAILAGNHDIVAINEAFSDVVREVLAKKLLAQYGGPYPYAILEAWSHGNFDFDLGDPLPFDHEQDSGLMLFSKFAPVKRDLGVDCNMDTHLTTVGFEHPEDAVSFTCSAGFQEFGDLTGDDALAQKGFLWAFVQNPKNGKVTTILASHAQANYPGNSARAERMSNMHEIATMADLIAKPTDEVLVLGDLNVIGDMACVNDPQCSGTTEYEEAIEGPGSIFGKVGLRDAFRTSTSPEDTGFTWDGAPGPNGNSVAKDSVSQERLDYMLTNVPVGDYAPCFQHMTIQRHVDTIYGDASDHYGVAAVIGPTIPHCDPLRATQDLIDVPIAGALTHLNAYQWHRFENPDDDTWSVSLYSPDADVHLDVYAAADLSTELTLLEGEETFVQDSRDEVAVIAPVGAFYVRVRAADPGQTAGYILRLKPHKGLGWDDYIWLHSGNPKDATMPAMLAADPVTRLHFRFQQESLWTTAQGNQEHRFEAQLSCDAQSCMEAGFQVWDDQHLVPLFATPLAQKNLSGKTSGLGNATQRFYLTLDRTAENVERKLTVTRTTDLKTIDLQDLTCVEQEDQTGDDHIHAKLYIDGERLKPGTSMDLYYGKFDIFGNNANPSHGTSLDTHAIHFKKSIKVKLYEEDDADDDDYLGAEGYETSAWDSNLLVFIYGPPVLTPYTLHFTGDDAWYQLNTWVVNAAIQL